MHQSDDIDWFQFKQIFGHKIKLIMGLDTIVNIVILVIQEVLRHKIISKYFEIKLVILLVFISFVSYQGETNLCFPKGDTI